MNPINKLSFGICLLTFAIGQSVMGQSSGEIAPYKPTSSNVAPSGNYMLGSGDQVAIDVPDLSEQFNLKAYRVDGDGHLRLPFAGDIRAEGLTVSQLEAVIKAHLGNVLKNPDVVVTIVGFGSEPVSVLGAVNSPGIVQLAGLRNFFEVLSLAGGLRSDAGGQATITRSTSRSGAIPLPTAQTDSSGDFSVVTIDVKDILNSTNTAQNITMLPGDRISVPATDLVYILGSVIKTGGYPLNQNASLSALQVVSLAEGFDKVAAPQSATILRKVPGSPNRIQIAANLRSLAKGKGPEVSLVGGDILYIPNSKVKSIGFRTADIIVSASSAAVYSVAR
jgi:polysaccharide biosynthesis/export protein